MSKHNLTVLWQKYACDVIHWISNHDVSVAVQFVHSNQARFSATPLDLLHPTLATSAVSSISPLISSLGVFQLTFSSGQHLVVKVDSAFGITRVGAVVSAPSAAAIIGDSHVLVRIEVDAGVVLCRADSLVYYLSKLL